MEIHHLTRCWPLSSEPFCSSAMRRQLTTMASDKGGEGLSNDYSVRRCQTGEIVTRSSSHGLSGLPGQGRTEDKLVSLAVLFLPFETGSNWPPPARWDGVMDRGIANYALPACPASCLPPP